MVLILAKKYKKLSRLNSKFWQQTGQSMVEYTVVMTFGILVLTTGSGRNAIIDLTNTIRSNYDAYSYSISLSDYPDKENYIELIQMYNDQGMPSEYREYLSDNPNQMVDDIKDLALTSLPPEVQDAVTFAGNFDIGLDDFCDFCTGNPFDAL
ncbi:MAG: hypothetical protein D8M62_04455 [Proteobacteria bacterium]|nr:hypothetical protein [Pseudomonadota bacterium]